MSNLKREYLTTDVLVVGGGIAGLTAATHIKEINPDVDVLVMEKNTSGYSGKANRGGGVLQYFDFNHVKPIEFVAYHTHTIGAFLGNQNLLLKYVSMNNEMIDKIETWGVNVPRNEDGTLKVMPTGPMVGMIGVDLDITLKVAQTAKKLGVKFLDKVVMSDVLTNDEVATGGIGYSLLDGTVYVVKAKTVILATGSQNYKIMPMWNGRGDGIAAAYRAGAQMRNTEFGNFAQLYKAKSHHDIVFSENVMYDGFGENITKNFRRFREPDVSSTAVREWYETMSKGRGPVEVHIDEYEVTAHGDALFTTSHVWNRPYGMKIWSKIYGTAHDVDGENKEVHMALVGEQSPVKVDDEMQTTIKGLYAIGDLSYTGSASPGAVPAPPGRNRGSGILNGVFNGLLAAESVCKYSKENDIKDLDESKVDTLVKRAFAPLNKENGVSSYDIQEIVKEAVGPVENTVYMSQNRMDMCLRKINRAKELLKDMSASNFHELCNCHEAEAMVLSAEMQFRAASLRKESRGWFLREDYPEMNNKEWLKYIIVQNNNGEMTFTTEDVPIEQYPIQPIVIPSM
ncbi:MAG: FAD-binding protein [Lachnospirales bacterium]